MRSGQRRKDGGVQDGSRPRPNSVGSKSEREKGQRPNRDKVAALAESQIGEMAAAEECLALRLQIPSQALQLSADCSWSVARPDYHNERLIHDRLLPTTTSHIAYTQHVPPLGPRRADTDAVYGLP